MVSFLSSSPTRFPLTSPSLRLSTPSAPEAPGATARTWRPGAACAPRRIHGGLSELRFLSLDCPIGASWEWHSHLCPGGPEAQVAL